MSRFTQLPKLFPAIVILFILLFTNNGSILAQEPTPPTAETLPLNSAVVEEQTLAVENTSALAVLPPQDAGLGQLLIPVLFISALAETTRESRR